MQFGFSHVGSEVEVFRALRDANAIFLYTANVYRGLRGVCRFSLQYLWKRAVRITEKPYTLQRERLCMLWGNPVIFRYCGENPIITKTLSLMFKYLFFSF